MAAKQIVTCFSDRWYTADYEGGVKVSVSGNCWVDNSNKKGNSLADAVFRHFSEIEDISSFTEIIPSTGHFCIVLETEDHCFAITDRVRSIPLFYGSVPGHIYISDDARWIRSSIDDRALSSEAVEEFRYSGFVTGSNTLYPRVKQLQAGQWLVTSKDENSNIKCHRYYKYSGSDPYPSNKESLIRDLDKAFLNAFGRMIEAANGRTIVIPLSAGLDSRLVLAMLKRLDYKNIIAFSYGKEENLESQKSLEIAKQARCEWLFVPYTRKLWRDVHQSDLFKNYLDFANSLSMIPHIQDWIAVKHFKDNNLIPSDSIFAPGHTGDFIAGGHIPSHYVAKDICKQDVIADIKSKHYRLWDIKKAGNDTNDMITGLIEKQLIDINIDSRTDAANAIEYFDWQERQPKHVVNSVRIYEHLGYDWLLPLWDTEVIDFWQKVPLEYKIKKRLYKEYLHEKNFCGVFSLIMADTGKLHKFGIKKYSIAKKISDRYHEYREKCFVPLRKRYLDYYLDQYQWHGIYSYSHVAFKRGFHQNIYSLLSDTFISDLNKNHNI